MSNYESAIEIRGAIDATTDQLLRIEAAARQGFVEVIGQLATLNQVLALWVKLVAFASLSPEQCPDERDVKAILARLAEVVPPATVEV